MKYFLLIISLGMYGATQANIIKGSVWSQSYAHERIYEYQEAVELIQPLLKNDKTAELAHLRLGWLNYLQGNYRDSFNHYEESLDDNSYSVDAYLGMTLPLLAQKRYRTAIKYTKKALKLSPNNYSASAKMMHIYTLQKKWRTLKAYSIQVSNYYPSLVEPMVYVARASMKLGEYEEAKKYFYKVLWLMPTHIEANAGLVKLSDY
jgi:tetratricopeptide (TPR) repeat protein